ncbi:MAG TPA: V-type ATPase subunit [Clostridiales bacterium]|nr:V-type ATPase subunit [Clostridiales bacterium]
MAKDYTYAVARIRARELNLLSGQDLDSLLTCNSYNDALLLLGDKGWNTENISSYDQLLNAENEKLWQFMSELVNDYSVFDVFLKPNDFHNLKASIKAVITDGDVKNIFYDQGTVSAIKIFEAIKNREYNKLPDHLQRCAGEAITALLQTSDGQLCDIIIDKASLEELYSIGLHSDSAIIKLYAETTVAATNIKSAIRCNKTNKNIDFIKRCLARCDTLNVDTLAAAATKGIDEIYDYLLYTDYKGAVDALKVSATAFEIWCDNMLIGKMQSQKWEPFTEGPLIAYVLARDFEIKAVRMILSGKINNLDNKIVKERLRDMYV